MSYLTKVDRVLVLKDSAVVECGTVNQLVSRNGVFAQLFQQYFNDNDINDGDCMFMI